MSNLKYSKEDINKIKASLPYEKVTMTGYYESLLKLKKEIETIYDNIIWGMGYSLMDAGYHGWSGEPLRNMCNIDAEINTKIKEIYALILKATNTEIEYRII